jgi:hypothetical protein
VAFSRSNRETEPNCTRAERNSSTASNDVDIRLSPARFDAQDAPQKRAFSRCVPEIAATARLAGREGDLNLRDPSLFEAGKFCPSLAHFSAPRTTGEAAEIKRGQFRPLGASPTKALQPVKTRSVVRRTRGDASLSGDDWMRPGNRAMLWLSARRRTACEQSARSLR